MPASLGVNLQQLKIAVKQIASSKIQDVAENPERMHRALKLIDQEIDRLFENELAVSSAISTEIDQSVIRIDLDKMFWEQIKQAAQQSSWMPPEYMMNDWVADVINFLKNGVEKCR